MLLHVAVVTVAVGTAGAPGLAGATRSAAAPLEVVARQLPVPAVGWLVAVAAVSAMAGVLLNLLLGLSRVVLAMGRRGDMPAWLATIDARHASPRRAVIVTGALAASLVLIGSVKTTWSFSAFTVLVYYALTNVAALRLPASERRYPLWVPGLGLVSCLGLALLLDRTMPIRLTPRTGSSEPAPERGQQLVRENARPRGFGAASVSHRPPGAARKPKRG